MLATICVCGAYLTDYLYRVYNNDIGTVELTLSVMMVIGLLTSAYLFMPAITLYSLTHLFHSVHILAITLNTFFLFRDVLIPPMKRATEYVLSYFGVDYQDTYIQESDFNFEMDDVAIDRLFMRAYNQNIDEIEAPEEKIKPFNRLIQTLVRYANRYNDSLLGNIHNSSKIKQMKSYIEQITEDGNDANAMSFIKKKIAFKTSKLRKLRNARNARNEIESITTQDDENTIKHKLRFFNQRNQTINYGHRRMALDTIDREIQRQERKVSSLEACRPIQP